MTLSSFNKNACIADIPKTKEEKNLSACILNLKEQEVQICAIFLGFLRVKPQDLQYGMYVMKFVKKICYDVIYGTDK